MQVLVHYYSRLKELSGCSEQAQTLPEGSTVRDLLSRLYRVHPPLALMDQSILIAVGVDYQGRGFCLREGDVVSLLPPVQGG